MERDFNHLVQDVLSLDAEQRGMLVDKLLISLSNEERIFADHLEEAKRRLEAYDRGAISARDAKEVMARVRNLRGR